MKINLLTSINNLLESEEFTRGYQDKNHEYFMDYVHPENGDDIRIYLSEYKDWQAKVEEESIELFKEMQSSGGNH